MFMALNILPEDPGNGMVIIVVVPYLNVAENTNPEEDAQIPPILAWKCMFRPVDKVLAYIGQATTTVGVLTIASVNLTLVDATATAVNIGSP